MFEHCPSVCYLMGDDQGRLYIGSTKQDLNKYNGSASDKSFKPKCKHIISTHSTRETAYLQERWFIQWTQASTSDRFVNEAIPGSYGFGTPKCQAAAHKALIEKYGSEEAWHDHLRSIAPDSRGRKASDESREKMRKSAIARGATRPAGTFTVSEEQRDLIRKSMEYQKGYAQNRSDLSIYRVINPQGHTLILSGFILAKMGLDIGKLRGRPRHKSYSMIKYCKLSDREVYDRSIKAKESYIDNYFLNLEDSI